MSCSTQALHRELIGQDVDGTLNQVCLSLAVQPTTMEVQISTETAAGERLFLIIFHCFESSQRNILFCCFRGFSFIAQNLSVMFHIKKSSDHFCLW